MPQRVTQGSHWVALVSWQELRVRDRRHLEHDVRLRCRLTLARGRDVLRVSARCYWPPRLALGRGTVTGHFGATSVFLLLAILFTECLTACMPGWKHNPAGVVPAWPATFLGCVSAPVRRVWTAVCAGPHSHAPLMCTCARLLHTPRTDAHVHCAARRDPL